MNKVGLQQSTIYKLMVSGDLSKQVRLTPKSLGWSNIEVTQWVPSKISGGQNAPH